MGDLTQFRRPSKPLYLKDPSEGGQDSAEGL